MSENRVIVLAALCVAAVGFLVLRGVDLYRRQQDEEQTRSLQAHCSRARDELTAYDVGKPLPGTESRASDIFWLNQCKAAKMN